MQPGSKRKLHTNSGSWRKITSRGSVRQASAKRTLRKDPFRSLLEGTCMLTHPTTQHIELWSIERLVEYPRNPRKNDGAVDRMCSSIREFGFKIPCLVRSDGEVVDGHLRLKGSTETRAHGNPGHSLRRVDAGAG